MRGLIVHMAFCGALLMTGGKSLHAQTKAEIIPNLSDNQLLDLVQKHTFRYFWDFAHPVSGLSRERSNVTHYGPEVVTIGGTGFGVMAMVVAVERGFAGRDTVVGRLHRMLDFLEKADRFHGIFPHWLDGATGKTIPFSKKDDGADLVETSFLFQGLLTARQYFDAPADAEKSLRDKINKLWREADWQWFTRGKDVLYWHWSPAHEWAMNHEIRGWNECLITYVLAASSPTKPISRPVYEKGWKQSKHYENGKTFYDIRLPLGFDYGGPLFFAHYSFLGLDPRGLNDGVVDYWELNRSHALINYQHCVRNPKSFAGYGADCWGITASDSPGGYDAHSPTNDLGVISPTAALSSFPYTPQESMRALRHFYEKLGHKIWSEYGFIDAFSEQQNWYAGSHLAIDQGPIIVMIENHRSGLLWRMFMGCPELKKGLGELGFRSTHIKS